MTAALTVAAVAAGVSAGIAFTFSNFVMAALDRLAGPEAVRAMQHINETVLNPLFLAVFIGTGAALLALCGWAWAQGRPVPPGLLIATAVYGLGVVGVTALGNVPLNERLAAVDAASATPQTWWAYRTPWQRLNHARALAAAVASAALTLTAAG